MTTEDEDRAVNKSSQSTRLEYARSGLIGCLTPQANTTVEPEFNILIPPGFAVLNARLTSRKDSIEARLADYMHNLDQQYAQFGNAPLQALALATTGASYLTGRAREDAQVDAMQRKLGIPVITAARAVCDALGTLSATRIALVSPYPEPLTEQSVRYWTSRGLHVAQVKNVYEESETFHPIYSLRSDATTSALHALRDSDAQAIVMLGTGLPTLRPIAAHAAWQGPPVLSCMLCLVWRTVLAVGNASGEGDAHDLNRWMAATHWRERLPQEHATRR